jgi:hypothetical protein
VYVGERRGTTGPLGSPTTVLTNPVRRVVMDGQIIAMNAHSGHYKPSVELERQVLDQLEAQGIDMSQVRKDLM